MRHLLPNSLRITRSHLSQEADGTAAVVEHRTGGARGTTVTEPLLASFCLGTLPAMGYEEPSWDGPYVGQFGVLAVRAGVGAVKGRDRMRQGEAGGWGLSTNP